MAHRRSIACCLTALLGASACSSGRAAPPEPAAAPRAVPVALVEAGPLRQRFELIGIVEAQARTRLATAEGGQVSWVGVREGDLVKAGDPLVRLHEHEARLELAEARASLERASTTHEQAQRVVERTVALPTTARAEEQLDEQRAAAQGLAQERRRQRVRLEQAHRRLHEHTVRAPFAGMITERRAEAGDHVDPGVPVLELVDVSAVRITTRLPMSLADIASRAHTITIESNAGSWSGRLDRVVPEQRRGAGGLPATFVLEPGAPTPLLGDVVKIRLEVAHPGSGVLVPRDAVVPGDRGSELVTVLDDVAHRLEATVLAVSDDRALVSVAALHVGDAIVIRGQRSLPDGAPVRTIAEVQP